MKNETIFLYANPEFDKRFTNGISILYQIFCKTNNYNLEIINSAFLSSYIPNEEYSQTLIIAGGDGTIHRVINTIPDDAFNKYKLGIIPAGTANEFAKSLHIPISIYKAADLIINTKKVYYQHVGIVNNHCKFITGILYGIASQVLRETPVTAKHFLGIFSFYIGLIRILIKSLQSREVLLRKFKINSREFRTNYLLINNANLLSKDLNRIDILEDNPNLFSLIYVHSRLKFIDILRLILKEKTHYPLLHDPALYFEQLSHIKLEFTERLEFLLDGDYYIFDSPINIEFFKEPIAVISG